MLYFFIKKNLGEKMEKILKALMVFWGIVITIVVLRYALISVDFNTIDTHTIIAKVKDQFNTYMHKINHNEDNDGHTGQLHFPLEKAIEMVLENTQGCTPKELGDFKRQYASYSSSCWNNNCTLSVGFDQNIPKNLDLFVKEEGLCIKKNFEVASHIKENGYRVDLQLTASQKAELGILRENDIRLSPCKRVYT